MTPLRLAVKDAIEANLPKRGGKTRALTKEDFSQKSAIFLQEKSQFDTLVALTDSDDRAKAIIEAMESIEEDYENLRVVLPKSEYQELDNQVLGQLIRSLNPDELNRVSGDVFGRIYEYFLTQFADQKAHDGGEFFTPGRYVGVAPEEVDEDFDFEEALRDIHVELDDLNAEATQLAATIKKNFEELGV